MHPKLKFFWKTTGNMAHQHNMVMLGVLLSIKTDQEVDM